MFQMPPTNPAFRRHNPPDGSRGMFQMPPANPAFRRHNPPDGSRGMFQIQPTPRSTNPLAEILLFRPCTFSPRLHLIIRTFG